MLQIQIFLLEKYLPHLHTSKPLSRKKTDNIFQSSCVWKKQITLHVQNFWVNFLNWWLFKSIFIKKKKKRNFEHEREGVYRNNRRNICIKRVDIERNLPKLNRLYSFHINTDLNSTVILQNIFFIYGLAY